MRLGVGPGGVSPNEQTAPAIECSRMIQKTSPSHVNEEAPLRGRIKRAPTEADAPLEMCELPWSPLFTEMK